MRSSRALVRILSSSSVTVFGSTGASTQSPFASRICRNTETLTPSARSVAVEDQHMQLEALVGSARPAGTSR